MTLAGALNEAFDRLDAFEAVQRGDQEQITLEAVMLLQAAAGIDVAEREALAARISGQAHRGSVLLGVLVGLFAAESQTAPLTRRRPSCATVPWERWPARRRKPRSRRPSGCGASTASASSGPVPDLLDLAERHCGVPVVIAETLPGDLAGAYLPRDGTPVILLERR